MDQGNFLFFIFLHKSLNRQNDRDVHSIIVGGVDIIVSVSGIDSQQLDHWSFCFLLEVFLTV